MEVLLEVGTAFTGAGVLAVSVAVVLLAAFKVEVDAVGVLAGVFVAGATLVDADAVGVGLVVSAWVSEAVCAEPRALEPAAKAETGPFEARSNWGGVMDMTAPSPPTVPPMISKARFISSLSFADHVHRRAARRIIIELPVRELKKNWVGGTSITKLGSKRLRDINRVHSE